MTPFGDFMRVVRRSRRLLLKDVARMLGVTPSYLSMLEHGRKGKPATEFINRLKCVLNLSDREYAEMLEAAKNSAKKIELRGNITPDKYRVANVFARKLPSLSDDQLSHIRRILTVDE